MLVCQPFQLWVVFRTCRCTLHGLSNTRDQAKCSQSVEGADSMVSLLCSSIRGKTCWYHIQRPSVDGKMGSGIKTGRTSDMQNPIMLHDVSSSDSRSTAAWCHVLEGRSLFSLPRFGHKFKVDLVAKQHHVYLPPSGRINLADLTKTR